MQISNQKAHAMTALLAGVSMTMSGIAPSPERATQLSGLLDRFSAGVGISIDKVKSVLGDYAAGGAPARSSLLEAGAQWRESVPVLRHTPDAPRDADAGERPRG